MQTVWHNDVELFLYNAIYNCKHWKADLLQGVSSQLTAGEDWIESVSSETMKPGTRQRSARTIKYK